MEKYFGTSPSGRHSNRKENWETTFNRGTVLSGLERNNLIQEMRHSFSTWNSARFLFNTRIESVRDSDPFNHLKLSEAFKDLDLKNQRAKRIAALREEIQPRELLAV